MLSAKRRQDALVEAGIALTSELSLDAVLRRLTELAAELTGARYAALGVIDQTGAALEGFYTHGVGPEVHEAIGRQPRGRGILGVLMHEPKPLRLHDLRADPRAVGFPSGHPEMRTFLGMPIKLRDVAYGHLYLTEKEDGADFTEEDEEVLTLLAAQAAVAIENARLYEAATRWSRQLESVNEVITAIAGEVELPRLLDLVATRLRELLGARIVAVVLPHEGGLRIAAGAGAEIAGTLLTAASKSAKVLERRQSERVDRVADDPEADRELVEQLGVESAIFVPLLAADRALGLIVAADKLGDDPRLDDEDLRLVESFARRAAVAVELSQRVARDALRRVVRAQEQERRRLARELHDETGQALASILLGLKSAEDASDPAQREAVARLRELVVTTLHDVRRLAVELRPAALDDFGLVPALGRLAESFREGSEVELEVESRLGEERLPGEVETAVYRIVQEALTNVLKHAGAKHVSILLTRKNESVSIVIEDDGRGFRPGETSDSGLGLAGMQERVNLLDGTLAIESSPGKGTTLVVSVPA